LIAPGDGVPSQAWNRRTVRIGGRAFAELLGPRGKLKPSPLAADALGQQQKTPPHAALADLSGWSLSPSHHSALLFAG
jgi:hypothetical protein